MMIALIGGVLLPGLIGFLTYRINDLLVRHDDGPLAVYANELAEQRSAVTRAKADAATHLNALAAKLGSMQAQVLRLNALGSRLAQMAGLDRREFDFNQEVGQGGPEAARVDGTPNVHEWLDNLTSGIEASKARLQALETLILDRKLNIAVAPTGWPAEGGFVSSGFGHRADPFTGHAAYHEGVDIAAHLGSQITAMGDGVVSFAGDKQNYGKVVEITHAEGLVTRYGHTLSLLVKVGDKVTRGYPIALVGSSGRSTGPHIHVEVLKNGHPINPADYLRQTSTLFARR